jgi:hypothetical protein
MSFSVRVLLTSLSVELPDLKDVRGAFNIQSSEDITSVCNHFMPLSGSSNVIKGAYSCKGGEASPGGSGTLPSGTNSGGGSGTSGSSSKSSSASSALKITGATGFMGVVAAMLGML